MPSFKRIAAILLRQYYLMRGSAARVVPLFAWVTVDIVLWGFITRYLNHVSHAGFNFVPALLGAVLLWDFLTRVMQGVTMTFFEDVWSRNFLNIFASPLSLSEYLTGLVGSSIVTSVVGLVVMLLMATLAFGLSYFVYGLMFVPFILILFLSGIALGIFGSALVLRLGPAAEWFVWPIPALVSPFAGVFYPLSVLPTWMHAIAWLLPPAYVFEGMRALVAHQEFSLALLAIGGGLAVFYVLLAGWTFTHVYRRAVRTGLIARYSAETVN
ncbi:MAG: ABC transporter permease [Gammaproteobacteria bacterium]|nr:ABC transporter permease [Gammaproteobacteria bacterium]MDE1984701.1 ABC transporter permease [Gammaproteobacteria bacterium]MDE2108629.1 ABC transporter permease [Gammaproteobacteria bacterium]MDE2460431.1 ABC transporter permease [Gammaproteobacteria bacterium]